MQARAPSGARVRGPPLCRPRWLCRGGGAYVGAGPAWEQVTNPTPFTRSLARSLARARARALALALAFARARALYLVPDPFDRLPACKHGGAHKEAVVSLV